MRPINNLYRLTVDEHGEEDCRDFTAFADAAKEFRKAARRKTVFSVRLDKYDINTGVWTRAMLCDNYE